MGYDDPWEKGVVGPHGAIEEITPGLWWVWAPTPGVPVRRNMLVYQLADGGLLLHSPTCLDDEQMKRLDGLGPVTWLLVPNEGHRLDIKRYKRRYPDAKVIAPRNARKKVEEVVAVDQDCEDALPPLGIRIHRPDGMKDGYELIYEVDLKAGGKGLLVNDVLGGPHPHGPTGLMGMMNKVTGPPGGKFGQARIVRMFFGKDPAAFRGFVERLSQVPDLRVLASSHGGPITVDVAGVLKESLSRL